MEVPPTRGTMKSPRWRKTPNCTTNMGDLVTWSFDTCLFILLPSSQPFALSLRMFSTINAKPQVPKSENLSLARVLRRLIRNSLYHAGTISWQTKSSPARHNFAGCFTSHLFPTFGFREVAEHFFHNFKYASSWRVSWKCCGLHDLKQKGFPTSILWGSSVSPQSMCCQFASKVIFSSKVIKLVMISYRSGTPRTRRTSLSERASVSQYS